MPDVFITRNLSSNSILTSMLRKANLSIQGFSLLQFSALPFSVPPTSTWRFFYSPRGVRYYFEKIKTEHTPLAAMGPATAKAIREAGYAVSFEGNGKPLEVAAAFREVAKSSRVVFVQAQHSMRSIEKLLSDDLVAMPLVVYQNTPLKEFTVPESRVLVFTSPMNTRAYFSKNEYAPNRTYLAIGPSTETELKKFCARFYTAPHPGEEGLVRFLLDNKKSWWSEK